MATVDRSKGYYNIVLVLIFIRQLVTVLEFCWLALNRTATCAITFSYLSDSYVHFTFFLFSIQNDMNFVFLDTHALVQFLEEDATAIVPVSRLKEQENLEHGGSCIVTWSNKKAYKAMLICSGLHNYYAFNLLWMHISFTT